LSFVGACANKNFKEKIQETKDDVSIIASATLLKYANTITKKELEVHLEAFASEEFQGRATGTLGHKKAATFLANYYKSQNITSPLKDSTYFQTVPKAYLGEKYNPSNNVLAFIEGSEFPNQVIIITAHLDHEGVKGKDIYYGADDDGSGTVAIMEMAQAFKLAFMDGITPKRSILFLHVTAEEIGLHGSRFYTENPVFPLENTVANLNIDMIGRIDKQHEGASNYIYLIGSNRLSTQLHYLSETVNTTYSNLDLDYTYNDPEDRNRYYYRSDHYNFAKHNIPVIFYFNGEHKDYHKPTDTPDKINYSLLEKRTKLIFATAWELANRKERIIVDKTED
jgi:Zn-dependent M28 family amino/carboxypeptidase